MAENKNRKEYRSQTKIAKCSKCGGFMPHYIFGKWAVCTGCGDEKPLDSLEIIEMIPVKKGGREKRV